MPPNIIPTRSAVPSLGTSGQPTYHVDRRTARELVALGNRTALQVAGVQATAIVRTEQLHEVDRLAREAISGQAMLRKWSDTLAAGDPFIADDLKFFTDVAKLAKGELLTELVSDFRQGGY